MTRVKYAAILLFLSVAKCAADPYAAYEPVPPAELTQLVSGRSLLLSGTADRPAQTLLYLAPDGGGWGDARLTPGTDPSTGDMAAVLGWQVDGSGSLCVWSAPLIGAMPSFAPPRRDCLRFARAAIAGEMAFAATVGDANRRVTVPVQVRGGNMFPAGRIAQYELQVRVLYGGQLPNWSIP